MPQPIETGSSGGGGDFESEFNRRLDQKDCRKKLNALFKALGGKGTVEAFAKKFFEGVDKKSIEFGNPTDPNASASYEDGKITIRPRDPNEPEAVSRRGNAGNFIHELMHAVGGNVGHSHERIVRGIAEVDGTKFKTIKSEIEADPKIKGLKGDAKKNAKDSAFSKYFNKWLGENCPI